MCLIISYVRRDIYVYERTGSQSRNRNSAVGLNCSLEAGIAVGVDPNLPDDIKLPLLVGSNLQRAVSLAGAWARSKFANLPPAALDLMTSGAMTCVMFGLLRKVNGQPDGDWMPIPTPPEEAEGWDPVPANTYTVEALRTALTVIVATKANWWLTNHHTGQGAPSGYVLKTCILRSSEPTFWEAMVAKLDPFFHNHVAPEIVDPRLCRSMPIGSSHEEAAMLQKRTERQERAAAKKAAETETQAIQTAEEDLGVHRLEDSIVEQDYQSSQMTCPKHLSPKILCPDISYVQLLTRPTN
ncbi:unnamed protein product [Bemisia tabaci]|uniref:Uncharacterized protein n=1 Tax=Bemisia tabaci TaxID=7038 RepID=A0A9P0EZ46_BEMTA|nr:unnamed protein product [Bemisia tabaci]